MNIFNAFLLISLSWSACHAFEDKYVFEYLNDNGYSLFTRLVTEAQLETTLNSDGLYTVLAPSNVAIAQLDPDLMVLLGNNNLLLKNLIRYHIIQGFELIPEFKDGVDKVALNGQPIAVSHMNTSVLLNNASMITSKNDIVLKNGIVHEIDTVLIPPVFSTNNLVAEFVIRDDMFNEFLFSLLLTNMTDLLERGEYTVFAPTDSAFTGDVSKYFYRGMPNAGHFYSEMLRYHIVPGARTSGQLQDGQVLYTLHGTPIHISITSAGVFADGAQVVQADIGASNGVIHALDGLLFPDDLLKELQGLQQQG